MNPAQIQLIAATLQAKYLRLINERGLPRPSPIQRYGTGRSSSSHNSRNNEEVRNNQTQGQKEMLARLKSGLQTALVYENDELQVGKQFHLISLYSSFFFLLSSLSCVYV